jgi:hypothetical protein
MDDMVGRVFWLVVVLVIYGATKLVKYIFRRLAELETRLDAIEARVAGDDGQAGDAG